MLGRRLDAGGGALQIKERPTTGRTGHIIGLKDPATRRLENIKAQAKAGAGSWLAADKDRISDPVTQQGPDVDRRPDEAGQAPF